MDQHVPSPRRKHLTPARLVGLGVVVLVPVLVAAAWPRSGDRLADRLVWQQVSQGDLDISVVERGNLESQTNLQVYCEVEAVRRDGVNGTPIQWIVPNGASVKKGDLLVELESTPMQEEVDTQLLRTEQSRADHILAQSTFDNQKTQNATAEAEAQLSIELAKLELEMFIDEESGSFKLAVEEIKRSIDDINNEILAAQANLELKRDDRRGIESLFQLGYANRNELRRSELGYLQAEGQYAAKLNRLETELATLRKKEDYERRMQMLTLQGKVDTAERSLVQVQRNNEAKLAQVEAQLRARSESLKKEEERLSRFQGQLAKCKIYAPQDGMVAYATGRNVEIGEGLPVRFRQHILSIPSLKKMQVRTSVHESVLDQILPGQRTTVRVDAFPDRRYEGTVASVAVLPEQNSWMGSDTKVYETIVTIDTEVDQLKPGMTAITEIHVDRLVGAVTVPVQSVFQRRGANWLLVHQGNDVLVREVQLGRSNDSQVEVTAGVEPGEVVAMNPTDVADRLLADQHPAPGRADIPALAKR